MNALTKVLVVDDGHRRQDDLLSVELAGLGLSSVTTSFEAATEVLSVIDRPSAIVLRVPLPDGPRALVRTEFDALAEALRGSEQTSGIPVIVWDSLAALEAGGISAVLRSEVGPQVLSEAEL